MPNLTDYKGKAIIIDKTGSQYPLEACLLWETGRFVLDLNAKLHFWECCNGKLLAEDKSEFNRRKSAALKGFSRWAGDYTAFGKPLTLKLQLTQTKSLINSINIYLMPERNIRLIKKLPYSKELVNSLNRSYVFGGIDLKHFHFNPRMEKGFSRKVAGYLKSLAAKLFFDWSQTGVKFMYLAPGTVSEDVQDLYSISNIAKHEFGHILGLGDMYADESIGLYGVTPRPILSLCNIPSMDGSFSCHYNSVMCNNSHINNFDIEMVLLALSTGERQNYQQQWGYGKVSRLFYN